jgi:hypothetical protein
MTAEWPWYARFRPIQQWPGENTRNRRASNFSASWSSTLSLLDRELSQLGAKNVVIQMAVAEGEIRNDGYPRANARPVHPGVIVSLDSAYGPLSYPCDTFTSWQDNLRAVALALEALRAVDRYGVTKRGEQYTGWKQLGTAQPAWSVESAALHIAQAAWPEKSTDEVRHHSVNVIEDRELRARIYRRAASRLHPDAPLGNTSEFQKLNDAKRFLDGAA